MRFDIQKLIAPRSVAVVGASPRKTAAGYRVLNNLKRVGFAGPLYPVNPRYEAVLGLKCYPSLADLPDPPDIVFAAIPAASAVAVIEQAGRLGIGGAIVNASGFADSGPDGEALQCRLRDAAVEAGLALCGPNNMGFINLHDRIGLWTGRALPPLVPGSTALISQSGSVAIATSEDARQLGFSHIITVGNEAVCTASDYLQAVVRDARVRVVMLFLETIRNPRLFADAALEAAERGTRIVVLKAGRSEGGRAASVAHTGALSGDDAVYGAFFRRYGVIRANDIDEMVETAMLLSKYPAPPEPPEAIAITVSGGEAALIADLGAELGLRFPALSPVTLERLKPAFPPFSRPRNPVDVWGFGWESARFRKIWEALLAEPNAGVIACALDAPAAGGGDAHVAHDMATIAAETLAGSGKKAVFFSNVAPGNVNLDARSILDAHRIPYLCGMRPALAAIARWTRAELPPARRQPSARMIPDPAQLGEPERFQLLAAAGIPMAPCVAVKSAGVAVREAQRLGYPVVLKGTGASLTHKTELGLVKLDLTTRSAVKAAFGEIAAALKRYAVHDDSAAVVIQPMVVRGVKLLLGVRNDPQFGTVLVAGLGGTLVEVLTEVSLRLGPVDCTTAHAMLNETKAAMLLAGTRGQGPFDIDAAVGAIAALSRFGYETQDTVAAVEINPLIVREQGKGAVGVDLVLELRRPT